MTTENERHAASVAFANAQAENAKLREALEKLVKWAEGDDDSDTYFDIMREARAALGEKE